MSPTLSEPYCARATSAPPSPINPPRYSSTPPPAEGSPFREDSLSPGETRPCSSFAGRRQSQSMKIRRQNRLPACLAHDWVRFVIRRNSRHFPPIRDWLRLTPFSGPPEPPPHRSHPAAPFETPRYAGLLREAAFFMALKFKDSALLRSAQSARLEARGGRALFLDPPARGRIAVWGGVRCHRRKPAPGAASPAVGKANP